MKTKDISDKEIKILGQKWQELEESYSSKSDKISRMQQKPATSKILMILLAILLLSALLFIAYLLKNRGIQVDKPESVPVQILTESSAGENTRAYIETVEETINDVPIMIYIPHNAVPELMLGFPEEADSSIVYIAPAAAVSGNNYDIIGDFVLRGEQLSRGIRKQGFCAIVNREITVGVGGETPLLERAIREKGYFFRQYPLVKNGKPVENQPKGKSLRRTIAIRDGIVMMIESRDRESFHDFAQALADAGVSEAIYMDGGEVYRWYTDKAGKHITSGNMRNIHTEWKGLNFLIWREK